MYLAPRGATHRGERKDMRFQSFGDRYIIRLESGESVVETLQEFLRAEQVGFGNLSAAGALEWIRLAYWNAGTRQYEYHEVHEQLEVVSFQGNASWKDGEPRLHLHGAVARRDLSVLGGHIVEARAHPTMEVWLRAEEIQTIRKRDQASGLDLLDLPERPRLRRAA